MVVGGWPRVPEQPYLVRGSAGTDCKGNLGHSVVHGPIESVGHRLREPGTPISELATGNWQLFLSNPEYELAEPDPLGVEGLQIDSH